MGAEMWQFVGMAAVGAVVITLWILFVYLPRNTGEGAPPIDPSENEEVSKRD